MKSVTEFIEAYPPESVPILDLVLELNQLQIPCYEGGEMTTWTFPDSSTLTMTDGLVEYYPVPKGWD